MLDSKCKKCRRTGEKLFLKGDKCFGAKCTFVKKPYAPGKLQSERKHRSMITEYGKQLLEKQKIRNTYGLREKQFSNYIKVATGHIAVKKPSESLYEHLESRLDNVVYRLGFATSRALARQLVSHGHVCVNGRKISVPSYATKVGDKISIREGSKSIKLFENIDAKLSKMTPPKWLAIDVKSLSGEVMAAPKKDQSESFFNLDSVIEFYSR